MFNTTISDSPFKRLYISPPRLHLHTQVVISASTVQTLPMCAPSASSPAPTSENTTELKKQPKAPSCDELIGRVSSMLSSTVWSRTPNPSPSETTDRNRILTITTLVKRGDRINYSGLFVNLEIASYGPVRGKQSNCPKWLIPRRRRQRPAWAVLNVHKDGRVSENLGGLDGGDDNERACSDGLPARRLSLNGKCTRCLPAAHHRPVQ